MSLSKLWCRSVSSGGGIRISEEVILEYPGMEGKHFLLTHETWGRHATSMKWKTEESSGKFRVAEGKE